MVDAKVGEGHMILFGFALNIVLKAIKVFKLFFNALNRVPTITSCGGSGATSMVARATAPKPFTRVGC